MLSSEETVVYLDVSARIGLNIKACLKPPPSHWLRLKLDVLRRGIFGNLARQKMCWRAKNLVTPLKFNIAVAPEKWWFWRTTFLLGWTICTGYVKLWGCNHLESTPLMFNMVHLKLRPWKRRFLLGKPSFWVSMLNFGGVSNPVNICQ